MSYAIFENNEENKIYLVVFFLFPMLFISIFFISKLILENKQNTRFEKRMFIVFIVLDLIIIPLFLILKLLANIQPQILQENNSFIIFAIFIILYVLTQLLFIPLYYNNFKKRKQEKIYEREIEKEEQIKKLNELNSSNIRFYIHRIRNNFTPLQALIIEEENQITPDLKNELEEQIQLVNEAIEEFSRIDSLYKKQDFLLEEFNAFKIRYISF